MIYWDWQDILSQLMCIKLVKLLTGYTGKLEGNLDYPIAALVMPATIDHIRAISLHGERMPAKSTTSIPNLLVDWL